MASKNDGDLVKIISQIKNQVKQAINQNESTREVVKQQVTDLQSQVNELEKRANEVIDNNTNLLKSLDEQLVQCSKLLDNPSLVSDTEKDTGGTTTDAEVCTDSDDNCYIHSNTFSSNPHSNDNANLSEAKDRSCNGHIPRSEHLELVDSSDIIDEESLLHVKEKLYPALRQKRHDLAFNRKMLTRKTHKDVDGKFVTNDIEEVEKIDECGKENE